MKRISLPSLHLPALLILCLLTNNASSQKLQFDSVAAYKAIEVQLRAYENALKNGDITALGKLYCIDAELMNNGSPSTIGRANILKVFAPMIQDSITGSGFVTTGLWGDNNMLIEQGTGYFAHANGKIVSRGRYLLIWKKEDGEWRIFRDTFFSDGEIK